MKKMLNIPLNRVEGDLEIKVELEGDTVVDAWSSGQMYRGFENLLTGRGSLDGLVITPRICGICSTSHLSAAAKALDMIAQAKIPAAATRIRNIALGVETLQSDIRHAIFMFGADFINSRYKKSHLFNEAFQDYEPLKGKKVIQVIQETKRLLSIIAIIGGQWPHSSYMVPGGIASIPSAGDMLQCTIVFKQFRQWYEKSILGCTLERFSLIKSESELNDWFDESEIHQKSHLGFYIRFARMANMISLGKGHGNFISYGTFDIPETSTDPTFSYQNRFMPAGFSEGIHLHPFDQAEVTEHVAYSWFKDDDEKGHHPFHGKTIPYASGEEGKKYSWAKAPRYNDKPAETGPLAEMIMAQKPLFTDYISRKGPDVFIRQIARLIRAIYYIPVMEKWMAESRSDEHFYETPEKIIDGEGYGLIQVTRGALGHWVRIKDEKIEKYQIITPTAWNGSPRDAYGVRGPWEEALIGTEIKDIENPIELGHVVRSFDPCLVCTVHALKTRKSCLNKIIL
ncbi:MAG: nickel-dependent hydrogenase large subunit [Desulfamplus sp.]|nr:nickel-dependent hydrogenase large subunit [Desulfamplus sp.]